MEIRLSPPFKRKLKKLAVKQPDLVILVMEKVLLFSHEPHHPSLRLHKLKGRYEGNWSFSIDYDIRVILEYLSGDIVNFKTIGIHDEVY